MSARVNLLPREIAERARTRRTTSWTVGAVAVFAALLGLLYLVKLGDVNAANQERDAAQALVDERQAELDSLEQFAQLDREVTARNALLSAAMATEISWARVFNDLALTFPASSSLLTLQAAMETAAQTGDTGTVAPDPNSQSIAGVTFEGYSVEQFAPGVERVLLKFSDVGMFINAFLTTANVEDRSGTFVTKFLGEFQLTEEARTGRYAEGLPPEVGQ